MITELQMSVGKPIMLLGFENMVKEFAHSGARDEVVIAAREHQCPICLKRVQPTAALPARVKQARTFGGSVFLDVFYIK
eukprot:1637947-Prorocentrum_lima.AAC.1